MQQQVAMTPFRGGQWTTRSDNGVLTLALEGEVDLASVNDLDEALATALARDNPIVVIDLDGVTFMDSTGLHFLVRLRNRVKESSRQLLLARASRFVQRLLQTSGLSDSFEYMESRPK